MLPIFNTNQLTEAVNIWNDSAVQFQSSLQPDPTVVAEQDKLLEATRSKAATDYYTSETSNDHLLISDTNVDITISSLLNDQSFQIDQIESRSCLSPFQQLIADDNAIYETPSVQLLDQSTDDQHESSDFCPVENRPVTLLPPRYYDDISMMHAKNIEMTTNLIDHHLVDMADQFPYSTQIDSHVDRSLTFGEAPLVHSYLVGSSNDSSCPDEPVANNSYNSMNPTNYDALDTVQSTNCSVAVHETSDEIGNGQFDRGPELYQSIGPSVSDTGYQALTVQQTSHHCETQIFTASDRPLQQIQYSLVTSTDSISCNQSGMQRSRLQSDESFYCSNEEDNSNARSLPNSSSNDSGFQVALYSGSDRHDSPSGANQLFCEVCGKGGFSTRGNLKRHVRIHSGEKPFQCEHCGSRFTENKSLKIHLRIHTGEKPYKCDICGKLFSQTGVLQCHVALHYNQRKFECNICGKAFGQSSQFKLHQMRHQGIKRLQCSICDRKFVTKGDLDRHQRTHTGERPFSCEICSKSFTRQQTLRDHINRQHPQEQQYDLEFCDRTISDMRDCRG